MSILCFLLLYFCSCERDTDEEQVYREEQNYEEEIENPIDSNANSQDTTLVVLNFLGDSIIDYWKNLDDYFPGYECHNYGWSAKGIDTFLGKVDVKSLENTECVVEIGTNDMRKVINAQTIDKYIDHYVDILISLKAKRIYLLSLLPRNRAKDGGFDFNSYYPEINRKIQESVANRLNNVVYVPLYDTFLKDGKINKEYTYDGLHPNTKGYEVMAKIIKEYMAKTVNN